MTRGGLVSALVEIANTAQQHITIWEEKIPVRSQVEAACEILGLDPLYVANEGKFITFVDAAYADKTLQILQNFESGKGAVVIGFVSEGKPGIVIAKNEFGGSRILDMFSGEQLPRIC